MATAPPSTASKPPPPMVGPRGMTISLNTTSPRPLGYLDASGCLVEEASRSRRSLSRSPLSHTLLALDHHDADVVMGPDGLLDFPLSLSENGGVLLVSTYVSEKTTARAAWCQQSPAPEGGNEVSMMSTPFRSELEDELAKLAVEDEELQSLRFEIHAALPNKDILLSYGRFSNAFDGQKQDRLSCEQMGIGRKSESAFDELKRQYPLGVAHPPTSARKSSFMMHYGEDLGERRASTTANDFNIVQNRLQEMQDSHNELVQRIDSLKLELNAHRGDEIPIEADSIQGLIEAVKWVLSRNNRLAQQHSEQQDKLLQQQQEGAQKMGATVAEIKAELQQELSKRAQQLAESKKQLADKIVEIEVARQMASESQDIQAQLRREIDTCKTQMKSQDEHLGQCEKDKLRLQHELHQLQQQYDSTTVAHLLAQSVHSEALEQTSLERDAQIAQVVTLKYEVACACDERNRLQHEKLDMTAKVDHLHQQHIDFAQGNQQTQHEIGEKQVEIAQLKEALHKEQIDREHLSANCLAMNLVVQELKQARDLQDSNAEQMTAQHVQARAEFDKTNALLQRQFSELQEEQTVLQSDLGSCRQEVKECRQKMLVEQGQVALKLALLVSQQSTSDTERAQRVGLQQQVVRLQQDIDTARTSYDAREAVQTKDLEAKMAEVVEQQVAMAQMQCSIQEYVGTIAAKDEELTAVRSELATKGDTLFRSLDLKSQEAATLLQQLMRARDELSETQEALVVSTRDLEAATEFLHTAHGTLGTTQAQLETLKSEGAEMGGNLEIFASNLRSKEAEMLTLQREITRLETCLAESIKERDVTVASLEMTANALRVQEENGVKAMQRENERQVKEVEDHLSRAQHAFATQSLELQHTSSKTDLLERDLQSLHALRGREKLLCDTELQDKISEAELFKSDLESLQALRQREKQQSDAGVRELGDSLADSKARVDELRRSLESVTRSMEQEVAQHVEEVRLKVEEVAELQLKLQVLIIHM